eukprot:COSAG03_NODE_2236_length_2973_cov_10.838900_3_plen_57_part_00
MAGELDNNCRDLAGEGAGRDERVWGGRGEWTGGWMDKWMDDGWMDGGREGGRERVR